MADDIVTRLRNVSWLAEEGSEVTDLAATAADEIEQLRRWKSEAIAVIDQWEAAWEAAGSPGQLGDTKSGAMRDEIGRLRDQLWAARTTELLVGFAKARKEINDLRHQLVVQAVDTLGTVHK